ncbi:TIGR04283 family arsenosugar biosynthesis glycosyltransferase [Desulfoluna spongiiphila]|uniref:TIGR04283 family arsenosugar biosynthesis glycosyltransferase n=1 Tax=Desulfoluna spongiiphila TaxID=419481 RepID=UPI001254EE78|nr:TIGR04283 family arsenosugar biosynthesis glycosyltransferase [Desulfoluna spongiiphila]VVS95539.1 nucleotide-diphospho-sugar transferases [Desulfoluna spongiiphila]
MPRISVIVPVLREPHIEAFLNRLFARFGAAISEVIIVDGASCGGTIASVKGPKVTTLVAPEGRGPQMNAGARASRGDILVFLHADTRLPDGAFDRIRETLSTRRYVAGAFTLRFAGDKKSFALISRAAGLRCRLTGIPYGDQAIFMTRSCFSRMGGYREIPVMEDIELMRRIRKKGGRIRILPEAVITSPRRWEKEGVIYSLVRTWLLATLFLCGVSPRRLLKHYRPERFNPD